MPFNEEKIACSHCHLSFKPSLLINQVSDNQSYYFCCKGCQGVFNLLHDSGLDTFYDRTKEQKLTPQSKKFEDSTIFDTAVFAENFIHPIGELCEVSLIVEGIHCSACVWLNEKMLHELEGVVEANINFSTHKAKILWDPSEVKLSAIIELIRSIGYDAFAYDPKVSETQANSNKKSYHQRLIVAVFASMNIMWIAIAQYAGLFYGMDSSVKTIFNVAEALLATPVLFYSGWVFFRGAYFGLKNHFVNMDILVATGALLTYLYSLFITLTQSGEAYFDSVVMIITFVLFGKYLELLSKKKASDTLDALNKHIPVQTRKLTDQGLEDISVHNVSLGDILEIHAGERFALDAKVVKGESYVDESSLTGERDPVLKSFNETIVSGTTNMSHTLVVEVVKTYKNSTFSKLLTLLDDALAKKPAIEKLANTLSAYFSTVILILAALTFFAWYFPVFSEAVSFDTAFMVGISVLIIACPCALALATPIASLVGVSMGAEKGVLFKESAMLETLAKTTKVFFDKTGTLTEGKLEVSHTHKLGDISDEEIAALLFASIHPVAKAIFSELNVEITQNAFDHYELLPGKGIYAINDGITYHGGSQKYFNTLGIQTPEIDTTKTLFFVAKESKLVCYFELEDKLRDESLELVEYLDKRGIELFMLTGDHEQSAKHVAQQLNISEVHASLSPEDKAAFIRDNRRSNDVIVMVGDGLNDILVLAAADIGIAMGKGADVTIDSSDVVLLHDDMKSLKEAFVISARSFRLIKQNLAISLVYNVITIPLAMAGYIIPLIAALSMSLSSLLVVGNSLRVKILKF